MKKLMTSIIIILPLLILAILLVSGAILSLVTHIYVESVEFVDAGALVLTMEDEAAPPQKQLEVNVLPLKAENRGLVYTVENENVASVDEYGVVTAKFYGETYITVTSTENKAASAKRTVVVTDVAVHKLEWSEAPGSDLYEGETQELSVTVYPKEAANKSVVWRSSDESILRVGAGGVVTAVGAGEVTVTAVSEDSPEVTVSAVFHCHKQLVDLEVDRTLVVTSFTESVFPKVTPVPADADVTLAYRTDDPTVATVDANGRIIFRREGHVVITVTATDFGGKTVEKQKEYTSTDGYFLPPLFAQKEFTVDFDDYQNGEALPIPFADSLEDSYREFLGANYTVENVLTFDRETKTFRFTAPMPVGTKTVKAEVTALVYSAEQRAAVEYEDYFYLTVLRDAKEIAVSYMETADVAAITIEGRSLSFSAEGGSEGAARVSVSPENHTNELSYCLESGGDVAELSGAGALTFRSAGEATVRIVCTADKTVTAEKTVRVIYAPLGAGEKKVTVLSGQSEDGTLLLTMESETDRQVGVLYYTEPAGAVVEYTAESEGGPVVELRTENGARRIVPVRGGFATVKISLSSEGAGKTYSVRVYVDCPVTADDLTVALGGKPCEGSYGTTAKSVEYLFTAAERNSAMAGKKLYMSCSGGKNYAEEGRPSLSGAVAFGAELSTLAVKFGVEYGDLAKEFGADEERLAAAVQAVTILRDAESVSVSYRGTDEPASVLTSKKSLTFTTEQTGGVSLVNVSVKPTNHTNTIRYSLPAGEAATITREGVLTFSKAGEVTVRIELCAADGHTTAEKEILVAYVPLGAAEKEIEVSDASPDPLVLLMMSANGEKDTGVIRFTEPAGAKVEYSVEKGGEDVVRLEEKARVQRIVPQKGGFATVKIAVTPNEGESGTKKEYTVRVYVDRAVEASDFKISFGAAVCDGSFGTTLERVPFTAEVNGGEGCMAGKKIYVSYGNRRSDEAGSVFSDEIEFPRSLGRLIVTFGTEYDEDAEAFGAEDGLSSVTRVLERNAEEIAAVYGGVQTVKLAISANTVTFAEGQSGAAFVSVTVSPETHTDTLSYALEDGADGIAGLTGGKLTFSAPGTVCVKILLEREGEITLQKTVTVFYEPLGENEKVDLKNDRTDPFGLLFTPDDAAKEGVIYFTEPEGTEVEYEITEGAGTVIRLEDRNGIRHIVPIGGGFATVKIIVSPNGAQTEARREYTVETYVDLPVEAGDFEIAFNGELCEEAFRTSRGSVSYTVTLMDRNGSTNGKKLYIAAGGMTIEAEEGVLTLADDAFELTSDSLVMTFGVDYGERAAALGARGGTVTVVRAVSTSRGTLDEDPTVGYPDGTLQTAVENPIEFSDIGEEIVFTVEKAFSPADFDLAQSLPSIATTAYVKASVSEDGERITLTALKPCAGQPMPLSIGNKTFVLSVTVHAKADRISISCGGKELSDPHYDTLLSELTFHVTIWREDGLPVDNEEIEYSLDGDNWQKTDGSGNFTAEITALQEGLLRFRSADQGANGEVRIEKVLLEEFGLQFSVRGADGADAVFGEIQTVLGAEELSLAVPTNMQGFVTVKVLSARSDFLGGFGSTEEEFMSVISIDLSDAAGWDAEYVPEAGLIVLGGVKDEFRNTVVIACGEKTVNVELSRINLEWIEFTGFDSNNKANGGDVYKGYQQVRVFAKQSVYGGAEVDYFRMPVKALKKLVEEPTEADKVALSKLAWKFTGNNDAEKTSDVLTEQSGDSVKYLGTEYTVADLGGGKYALQTKDGETVVGADGKYVPGQPRVTWVDAFSEAEQGYVRIYFGGYTGLTETDVRNDYFGNFGEETDWTPAETHEDNYDKSGRTFAASEGAFSYLRLEGGDGAANGKNVHFNFNVLEGTDLYNVFDAAGYLSNHKKIVLHNNLYGPKEVIQNDENDAQFLDDEMSESFTAQTWSAKKARYEKDLIYGNGYQVNLKTVNDAINTKDTKTSGGMLQNGQENTAYGFRMGKLYNVTLKGTTAETEITPITNRMLFNLGGAYYSTLQNYSKLNPSGADLYLKNSVLRYVANAAIQVWQSTRNLYFENVVISECLRAVSLESKSTAHFYFKGFTNVLNYHNAMGMQNSFRLINGGGSYSMYFVEKTGYPEDQPGLTECAVKDYLEWFGKDGTRGKENYRYYANMLVTNGYTSLTQKSTKQSHYWDNAASKYVESPIEQVGIDFADAFIGMDFDFIKMGVEFSTYATQASVDGGNEDFTSRNMDLLFTNARDIRLLCEYMGIKADDTLIKNTEHIQWHMNKVHRDTSLIEGWEDDHITALKQSLLHAKEKGVWDGKWPDGSSLGDALPEAAAQMIALLSETTLPSKRAF